MARYATTGVSQTAQLAGVNSTTTVNGYIGYWGASSTAGFRLRRLHLSTMNTTAVTPASVQVSIGVYRQTAAPSGTGLASAVLGQPLETHTLQTDPTTGLIVTTATTIGTTGPTLATNPLFTFAFNTQATLDIPFDYMEEVVCPIGTANGIALVNIGNTLSTGSFIRFNMEIEV